MPFDPYPTIARVVEAYDVRWVVVALDVDAATDPLRLWDGAAAVDGQGNRATFLPIYPSFDEAGVRVYEVTP